MVTMESFFKWIVFSLAVLAGGTFLLLWTAGAVEIESVTRLLVGALVVSPFIFIISIWSKMPFLGLRKSLLAFLMIVLVILFMMALLQVLYGTGGEGYFSGIDMPPYFLLASAIILLLAFVAN